MYYLLSQHPGPRADGGQVDEVLGGRVPTGETIHCRQGAPDLLK
jgi:hypothetical protein